MRRLIFAFLLWLMGMGMAQAGITITSFKSSPDLIQSGQSSTLSWTSATTSYTTCDLYQAPGRYLGTRAPTDSQVVKPTATADYFLACRSSDGSTASATTWVAVGSYPKPAFSYVSSDQDILKGQTVRLQWTVKYASGSCAASGQWSGSKPLSGVVTVTPPVTGLNAYTLTCTGKGGRASATQHVSTFTSPRIVSLTINPTPSPIGQEAFVRSRTAGMKKCDFRVSTPSQWIGTYTNGDGTTLSFRPTLTTISVSAICFDAVDRNYNSSVEVLLP